MSTTFAPRRPDAQNITPLQALPPHTAPLRQLTIMHRISIRAAFWLLARMPARIGHSMHAQQLRNDTERERREADAATDHYLRLLRV